MNSVANEDSELILRRVNDAAHHARVAGQEARQARLEAEQALRRAVVSAWLAALAVSLAVGALAAYLFAHG